MCAVFRGSTHAFFMEARVPFIGACMRCGLVLFEGSQVAEHSPTEKDVSRRGSAQSCTSVFLQDPPTDLMEASHADDASATEGKLRCTKCKARLGQWNWSGSQCSCGAWVTPAFQFTRSKIDCKPISEISPSP